MSAPPKPWERAGVNNARTGSSAVSSFTPEMSGGLPETPFISETARPMAANTSPPPLPTRPSQQRSGLGGYSGMGYGGYGGYGGLGGGMYGGGMYGGGMYGSSLGYGGYGGYGLNRFGANDGYAPNTFARQAEESSRQAFQSIESIVQAFGSVAMMLESTFSAVYNSFRAVIGVADHFSRMKTHFAQIFSALAVIRTLRWLYRKLLVMLRLRQGGLDEDLWNKAAETDMSTLLDAEGGGGSGGKASWPILLFFAVVVGGPYLIWRLLSSIAGSKDTRDWASGNADHFVGVAEFDFTADSEEEITFRKGQKLHVAPKELQPRVRGWLLASADGKKEGLVPANYLKILGKRTGRGNPGKQPEMGASVNASPQPALQSGDTAMNKSLTEKSQDSIWKEQDSVPSLGTSELGSQWHTDASKPGQMNPSGFPYQDVFDRQGAEAPQSDTDNVMNRTASDILDKSTKDTAD